MHVFLTGATGYIGSAVLDAALKGRHTLTALVRDGEKAQRVQARGVTAIVGSLGAPARWAKTARAADAIVHAAADYVGNMAESDRIAVETILEARPATFVYTSGVWVLGQAPSAVDEATPTDHPAEQSAWRVARERLVLDASGDGMRTIVVRPGIVYGGARGIVSDVLKDAMNGLIRVIGDGQNRWPLVYNRDLGDLYHKLLVRPDASGVYHATDGSEERVNDIVEAIRSAVSQPPSVRHVPLAEARRKMGAYADALALDQIVRSQRARALGWSPTLRSVSGNVPRLLEEFRRGKEAAHAE